MEGSHDKVNEEQPTNHGHKIIRHPSYPPRSQLSSLWFDLRVFYVRVSNCEVDGSTPEHLILNHIPLSPDTLLKENCGSSIYSEGVSSLLRRDRADRKSEEVTFVSTDSIRMTGSVKFRVYDREDLMLSGVLEMSNGNGFIRELKNHSRLWIMNCRSEMTIGSGLLKGKQRVGPKLPSPIIEVYVAGCFLGTPIVLTKTLQPRFWRKNTRKGKLDSIPENETTECNKVPSELAFQIPEFEDYKPENEEDYINLYSMADCIDGEDDELSWFNAGMRVGVGISLGICLGIGIGVGVLVRTYQATTKTFKRRLI